MKVFKANGFFGGDCRCGCCPPELDEHVVVVANTDNEALGLLLEEWPRSRADQWELREVDCKTVGVVTDI